MTDTMTIEELHHYQATGKMPRRFGKKTRMELISHVAEEAPDVADTAASAIASPVRTVNQQPKAKCQLETYLEHGGFGKIEAEYQFHPVRKWRADYALLEQHPPVLIEYDGLMHHGSNQGHASIGGILRDSEKSNAATALGFRCFRANAKSIQDGSFFKLMDEVLVKIEQ